MSGARVLLALLGLLALPAAARAAVATSGGTPTGQHAPAVEATLDARLQNVVVCIYRSRLGAARHEVDAARALAPRDPRVYLLEARVLRESFPDQNASLEASAAAAAPIHAALGHAVALCDSLLAHDPARGAAHLYRGWAYLFGAQMHALCGEVWSAGRAAKRGKEDLDRALQWEPDNRDGQGVLGTFLYFADLLPRAVKLARAVVGVPGGDAPRGLALLRNSAGGTGYNRLDAQGLLGAITVGFEGDFEAARHTFEAMLHEFPGNPRLAEPLAALDLFAPEHSQLERTRTVALEFAARPEDWYRQLSQRLVFYQSLQELLQGRAEDAIAHLEGVWHAGPTQPDWFPNDVAICLAEMHLLVGAPVPPSLHLVPDGKHTQQVAGHWRRLQQPAAVATPGEAAAFRHAQAAARLLYDGDLPAARRLLDSPGGASGPAAEFYRGELARQEGDDPRALHHYAQLTEQELPVRWRLYTTLAMAQQAEIRGRHAPGEAKALLGRALEFDVVRDLIRHLLRARQRHFDRLSKQAESTAATAGAAPPALLQE